MHTTQTQSISPYEIAKDELSTIRTRILEIEDSYSVELPILKKKADRLEAFVLSQSDIEQEAEEIKQNNREAYDRIQRRKQEEQRQRATRSLEHITPEPRQEPKLSQPRTLREVIRPERKKSTSPSVNEHIFSDDVLLEIAEFLQCRGPQRSPAIYAHLLEKKLIEPFNGEMPNKSFGRRLGKMTPTQDLFTYDHDKQLYSLVVDRPLPQRAVKDLRDKAISASSKSIDPKVRHTNGAPSTNGSHAASNGAQVTSDGLLDFGPVRSGAAILEGLTKPADNEDDAKYPGLDRSLHPFVMAVNVIFRDQDNKPMGARQIWEELEERHRALTGCEQYGQFTAQIERYKDFFAFDTASRTYYPQKPLLNDPMLLLKPNGQAEAIV